MTLTFSNRRIAIIFGAIALGAILALSIGWLRAAIVVACIASLVMVEWSLHLLSTVAEPKSHAPDPHAADLPCPSCEYSLRGLPPSGTCPECGSPYDLDQHSPPPAPPPLRVANHP